MFSSLMQEGNAFGAFVRSPFGDAGDQQSQGTAPDGSLAVDSGINAYNASGQGLITLANTAQATSTGTTASGAGLSIPPLTPPAPAAAPAPDDSSGGLFGLSTPVLIGLAAIAAYFAFKD